MAAADVEPAPGLPDYLTNPNAVLGDTAEWRYGRAPDYSNTRTVFENSEYSNYTSPYARFFAPMRIAVAFAFVVYTHTLSS